MINEIKFKMNSGLFIVRLYDMCQITIYSGGIISDDLIKSNVTSLITNKDLLTIGIKDFDNKLYNKKYEKLF